MRIRIAAAALTLAVSAAACGGDYDGPAYVVGRYTCVNPATGQPDYCVEYSDGTSAMVPFGIYDSAWYGTTLVYAHGRYTVVATSRATRRLAPDVYHVTYRAHVSGYSGMSYVSKGRVIYRGPASAGRSYSRTSYAGRH